MESNFNLRDAALSAFRTALRRIGPENLLRERIDFANGVLAVKGEKIDLRDIERVFVLAIGKAAPGMVKGIEAALADRILGGVVLSNSFPGPLPAKYRTFLCSHPLPSEQNVEAGKVLLEQAYGAREGDLVICCISGGGSAILSVPAEGVSLESKRETVNRLMLAGAGIEELNVVRKHISAVKGGRLAQAIGPARSVSLCFSDVPGDLLTTIASGPTVPDPSTFEDAWSVIRKYGLDKGIPADVTKYLQDGCDGLHPDTPGEDRPVFTLGRSFVVGSNRDALSALERELRGKGFWTMTELDPFQGEAREVGASLARKVRDLAGGLPKGGRPYALISGGETAVTVEGSGLGGRNCELTLAAAIELRACEKCLVLAAGTDGVDGPTDAAGAIADGTTLARAAELGLDPKKYLANNDSYNFFKLLGDLIITGPTGTNLMDISLALIG